MVILGVRLIEGNDYRIITNNDGTVTDRELMYLSEDGNQLIMDSRRIVDGDMIGGTTWIDKATIVFIEPTKET